jgi:GTP pyrophosphokinase
VHAAQPRRAVAPRRPILKPKAEGVVTRVVKRALGLGERRVKVRGLDDMMVVLARCCNPVRGEDIVGLHHARQGGLGPLGPVHQRAQPDVRPERRIDVEWDVGDKDALFDVKLAST